MDEHNTEQTPPTGKATETRGDLVQELRQLAETLEQAVRGLASSDRAKELEQELRRGVVTLRQQTETAMKEAKLSDAAQEFGDQAKRVAGEAVKAQPVQDALGVFARGIAALNQRLERYNTTGEAGTAASSASDTTTSKMDDTSQGK